MPVAAHNPLIEFARTIRLEHTLFALPFALGTALLAEPPWPDGWSLALIVACMAAARTAAMGMNRLADAALDARNPRTAGRAIPAGRLSRRAALAFTLASAAAFVALAWLFLPLRGNTWPGLLAPAFLAVLLGYSWTKRFTALTHWWLGLCLGLAPVGVWIALRGELGLMPVLIGAGVMFWTAGFDILYSLQDLAVDLRDGLQSVPARLGRAAAMRAAAACHVATLACLAPVPLMCLPGATFGRAGVASLAAMVIIAATLAEEHLRARRRSDAWIAVAFFPLNAFVSIIWLAGVVADVAVGLDLRVTP
ncbi:MAG: 4-hydroxybenzoate octaprenyltransferase [Planctomycetes bacterium]|nr:4-hydroxybenzoate octaprenyltransferase [Planctomycetota bacterium]